MNVVITYMNPGKGFCSWIKMVLLDRKGCLLSNCGILFKVAWDCEILRHFVNVAKKHYICVK